jgi:hypothetical protein
MEQGADRGGQTWLVLLGLGIAGAAAGWWWVDMRREADLADRTRRRLLPPAGRAPHQGGDDKADAT